METLLIVGSLAVWGIAVAAPWVIGFWLVCAFINAIASSGSNTVVVVAAEPEHQQVPEQKRSIRAVSHMRRN